MRRRSLATMICTLTIAYQTAPGASLMYLPTTDRALQSHVFMNQQSTRACPQHQCASLSSCVSTLGMHVYEDQSVLMFTVHAVTATREHMCIPNRRSLVINIVILQSILQHANL